MRLVAAGMHVLGLFSRSLLYVLGLFSRYMDTCTHAYKQTHVCVHTSVCVHTYEEEDTCMSYEDEDTCVCTHFCVCAHI
jgi:hypothetical protein